MKIVSRPNQADEDEMFGIGTGPNILRLTDEQLELVLTFIYHCRLGGRTVHSTAAFEFIDLIEKTLGVDVFDDACAAVDLQVTIEDDQGDVITTTNEHLITFEV